MINSNTSNTADINNNLEFNPVTLADRDVIQPILSTNNTRSSEHCFCNHYVWSDVYDTRFTIIDNFYVANVFDNTKNMSFLYPIGNGNIADTIEKLKYYSNSLGVKLRLHGILAHQLDEFNQLFGEQFDVEPVRNSFDYIYSVSKMATLSGKKYHSKRNHIKRFMDNDWSYEPITSENIAECLAMSKDWCRENDCSNDKSKSNEYQAIQHAINHFETLELIGGVLRVSSKVVAYTIGERLNSDTIIIHIEKAFTDIQGAYPAINQLFIQSVEADYTYVNREEDLGVEGLRKAKLSYKPEILLEKYVAVQKEL